MQKPRLRLITCPKCSQQHETAALKIRCSNCGHPIIVAPADKTNTK